MPEHQVRASMQVVELNRVDAAVELEVYSDSEKLGTIQIGRGSFRWKGRGRQDFNSLSWESLFAMLEENQ